MKTATRVLSTLCGATIILAAALSIYYVLSGKTVVILDTTYFIGHIDLAHPSKAGSAPEFMALIVLMLSTISIIFFIIGLLVETKGKPKEDKKAFAKKLIFLQIAVLVGMFASAALFGLAPKQTQEKPPITT
jgi:hypothetical protein